MNPNAEDQADPKPVAYDADGNPLYAAPPPPQQAQPRRDSHVTSAPVAHEGYDFDPRMRAQYANEPRVVHHMRQHEPELREMSDDLRRRCEESAKRYPGLNLSKGEFVIKSITRHPIGLLLPMVTTIFAIIVLLAALVTYPLVAPSDLDGNVQFIVPVTVVLLSLIVLVGIGGYAAVWVYMRNTFYLTSESVIQEIQHSLFSKHEQTVSLGSIEDASFRQVGIFQTAFNYGTIRLSTEGQETTYQFQYVDNPKRQISILNNAIEAFKNGRPVTTVTEDEQ